MRSLILYYTYHGNTQRIAERIHAAIGGDIARIDTVGSSGTSCVFLYGDTGNVKS